MGKWRDEIERLKGKGEWVNGEKFKGVGYKNGVCEFRIGVGEGEIWEGGV